MASSLRKRLGTFLPIMPTSSRHNQLLEDIQRAIDESVIVAVTDAEGVITYANDRFCEKSQYSREELLGNTHRLVKSGHHPPEFFAQMWQTITTGHVWRGEIQNKSKFGQLFWVKCTIVPFLDDHSKPFQYIAIRTDITDRKNAESEIQRLNTELEERVAERTRQIEVSNRELSKLIQEQRHLLQILQKTLHSSLELIDGQENRLPQASLNPDGQTSIKRISSLKKSLAYRHYDLSKREYEVLLLISEGLTNKEIADKLGISLYTVKAHVSKIIQKLGVADRTQVSIKALKEGLFTV